MDIEHGHQIDVRPPYCARLNIAYLLAVLLEKQQREDYGAGFSISLYYCVCTSSSSCVHPARSIAEKQMLGIGYMFTKKRKIQAPGTTCSKLANGVRLVGEHTHGSTKELVYALLNFGSKGPFGARVVAKRNVYRKKNGGRRGSMVIGFATLGVFFFCVSEECNTGRCA